MPELLLSEEWERRPQTAPELLSAGVHKPAPVEKEDSAGGIRPQPSAGRSSRTRAQECRAMGRLLGALNGLTNIYSSGKSPPVKAGESMKGPIELRLAKRYRVQLPISFSLEDQSRAGEGIVYNLSTGGCKVTSATAVSTGLFLRMRLHLPTHPSPLEVRLAAVRWAMAGDFGVAFLNMASDQHERLQRFLADLETAAPEERACPTGCRP